VSIEWEGGLLYVDPFELQPKKSPPADLVLLTNPRLGHASPEDVALVSGPETEVWGPADALSALGIGGRALRPGDEAEYRGLRVLAVPAGSPERSFYPLSAGWLGYVLGAGGRTLYHAGATEVVPEGIRADVAFLPASEPYTMDAAAAADAADRIGARERVALLVVGDRYRPLPGFTTKEGS
jgi:L-ascorbate metabolism protein UlaG (beta-lactamase superfamily)